MDTIELKGFKSRTFDNRFVSYLLSNEWSNKNNENRFSHYSKEEELKFSFF